MDSHAQYEIRTYANVIGGLVAEKFPLTWEAFLDYRINAITFSGPEIEAISSKDTSKLSKRECVELQAKLERIKL
jgi:thymidylate synthase (FAD)